MVWTPSAKGRAHPCLCRVLRGAQAQSDKDSSELSGCSFLPSGSLQGFMCSLLKWINLGGQQKHLSQRGWVLQGNLILLPHRRGIISNSSSPIQSLCPIFHRISCTRKEKILTATVWPLVSRKKIVPVISRPSHYSVQVFFSDRMDGFHKRIPPQVAFFCVSSSS